LPAKLGRCVITIEDTAQLLQHQQKLSPDIVKSTYQMRWRALHICKMFDEEKRLLIQLKQQYPGIEMTYSDNESPAWNMAEIVRLFFQSLRGIKCPGDVIFINFIVVLILTFVLYIIVFRFVMLSSLFESSTPS
jgi:hypothetical protein